MAAADSRDLDSDPRAMVGRRACAAPRELAQTLARLADYPLAQVRG